jgi:hypothetical protein
VKEVKVSCVHCGSGNYVDLDRYAYYESDYIGLLHKCHNCSTVFAFDVEVKLFSCSYDIMTLTQRKQ